MYKGFLWPATLLWFKGASQDSRASSRGIHGYASIKDMLNPDGMQRLETHMPFFIEQFHSGQIFVKWPVPGLCQCRQHLAAEAYG